MNLLQQIATLVGIAFIRPRKAFERGAERRDCIGRPFS